MVHGGDMGYIINSYHMGVKLADTFLCSKRVAAMQSKLMSFRSYSNLLNHDFLPFSPRLFSLPVKSSFLNGLFRFFIEIRMDSSRIDCSRVSA